MTPWTLHPLHARPQHLALLAAWHVAEWPECFEPPGIATARRELEAALQPDALPQVLVAVRDDVLCGSVSLLADDGLAVPWTPWLASLVVRPADRRRGLATLLVAALLEEARSRGHPEVFVWTRVLAPFFRRSGWRDLPPSTHAGRPVEVLRFGL